MQLNSRFRLATDFAQIVKASMVGGGRLRVSGHCRGLFFLTDVRQYIESSAVREVAPRLSLSPTPGRYLSEVPSGQAHGQAASPELVYIVGHGVCRNFQTPGQTRTSALPRRRIAETEAQEPERILQIQCIQPLEIG